MVGRPFLSDGLFSTFFVLTTISRHFSHSLSLKARLRKKRGYFLLAHTHIQSVLSLFFFFLLTFLVYFPFSFSFSLSVLPKSHKVGEKKKFPAPFRRPGARSSSLQKYLSTVVLGEPSEEDLFDRSNCHTCNRRDEERRTRFVAE